MSSTTLDRDRPRSPAGVTAIETEAVTKSYRAGKTEVQVLRGVSLRVLRGELVAVMGPSGCGKSTLLHALGGLLTPTSGRIEIEGRTLSSLTDSARTELRRRRIGFVFQKQNLLPTLTVEGNLRLQQRLSLGTHDARVAGAAERILLMKDGRIEDGGA